MPHDHLEGVAESLLSAVDMHPPISAFNIAHHCGLTVSTYNCQPQKARGAVLYFDGTKSQREQEAEVALHIAHWRLAREGNAFTDLDVEYLARAIMLPVGPFVRDLRRASGKLHRLEHLHRYATRAFIEQRIVDVETIGPMLKLVSA